MRLAQFFGITDIQKLTPQIYAQNVGTLYNTWNDHDSAVLQWNYLSTKGLILNTSVVASGAAYRFLVTDVCVVVSKTVGSATAITLVTPPQTGQINIVKDGKGDANVNNITVSPAAGTIDGAATYVMNAVYRGVVFLYNGTEWNKVALF